MLKVSVTLMISTAIVISLTVMCIIISKKSTMDREKMSPFECGFDPLSSARTPFSIQFFLIAILFLIFDIEIALILPMILTINNNNSMMWATTVFLFISTLIAGLYYEWKNGMLEWLS